MKQVLQRRWQLLKGILLVWGIPNACSKFYNHETELAHFHEEKSESSSFLRSSSPFKTDALATAAEGDAATDIVLDDAMNLKMYWHNESCWQEECDVERKWCMQCEGWTCNHGDILYLQPCKDIPQQKFRWIPSGIPDDPAGQIQLADDTIPMDDEGLLCLERTTPNRFHLLYCHEQYPIRRQLFVMGFAIDNSTAQDSSNNNKNIVVSEDTDDPFEIYPLGFENEKCLNMHHHPRNFEEIKTTTCGKAQFWQSNLWQWYNASGEDDNTFEWLDLELRRNPRCSEIGHCGLCQGHCVDDSFCVGNLTCFKGRTTENPYFPVPGCLGRQSVEGKTDFCYEEPPADQNWQPLQ